MCVFVYLLVTFVKPAKTAESGDGPREPCIYYMRVKIPKGMDNFGAVRPIKNHWEFLMGDDSCGPKMGSRSDASICRREW